MKNMKLETLLIQVLLENDGHRVGLLNVVCVRPDGVLSAVTSSVCFPIRMTNKLVLFTRLGKKINKLRRSLDILA